MGSLRLAMGDSVQPLHKALFEEVGRVGVVVSTRRIDEHMAPARVAVHVGIGSVEE